MITICVFVRYLTYFDGLLRHRGTEPGLWEVFTSSLALDHIIITSVTRGILTFTNIDQTFPAAAAALVKLGSGQQTEAVRIFHNT